MAKMNTRILDKINKELEYEEKEGAALFTSAAIEINGKQVRRKYKERYSNLLNLKQMLEKANNQKNNLLLYGEIGICKEDYYKFMHLIFDVDTNLPIPKNLFVYGIIPSYNIPAPPIAADNKTVEQVEFEYQIFYAKYGIVPEYENGIRKPYPHEMFNWNAEGAIESSYGKANNFYYNKRYLVEKKKSFVKNTVKDAFKDVAGDVQNVAKNVNDKLNNKDKKSQELKKKKRFSILKRRQATKEELNNMETSLNKEDLTIDKKKKLKRVLIGYGIAVGITLIAFNASVVVPALVSNPGILFYAPVYILKKTVSVFIKLGIPLTVLIVAIRLLIKDKEIRNSEEMEEELHNASSEDVAVNVAMDRLMQKIVENEKRIAAKDEEIQKEAVLKNDSNAVERLRKLQEERDELIAFKHQILDQMAEMTQVPGGSGGMTR